MCKSFTLILLLASMLGVLPPLTAPEASFPPPVPVLGRGSRAPSIYRDLDHIILANGIVLDTRTPWSFPGDADGHYILQCVGPIRDSWVSTLKEAGVTVYDYLPNYAFLVGMPDPVLRTASRLPFVRWIGALRPEHKIHADLGAPSGHRLVNVLLYPDVDPSVVSDRIEELGAVVIGSVRNPAVNRLRVEIGTADLAAIACLSEVCWIEPCRVPVLLNDDAQWIVQTYDWQNRRLWDLGIRGENQIASTLDSGVYTEHDQFRDDALPITAPGDYPAHRKIVAYRTSPRADFGEESGFGYHGTHTGGTTCGDDSAVGALSPCDGMALKARLYFWDIGATFGLTFDDLYGMFRDAAVGNAAGGANTISNSWSYLGADGQYISDCREVDRFVWDYPSCLPFFSTGNLGPGDPSPVANPPSTAKNVVSVGALYGGGEELFYWSNYGPLNDGRRSPILTGPGSLRSAVGGAPDAYAEKMGTSMSCPCVAAATLLARQYFTEGWYPSGRKQEGDGFIPSAALLKATAIASADIHVSSYVAPDDRIGWGRINLDSALYFAGDARGLLLVDDTLGLETGEYVDYEVPVADPALPLRISLVWSDFPASVMARHTLVNDLDLTATDGLTTLQGNLYLNGESVYYPSSRADSVNDVETIYRSNPRPGTWIVRVSARNVPFGPQPYALVITGSLVSSTGIESPPPIPLSVTASLGFDAYPNPAVGPIRFRYALPSTIGRPPILGAGLGIYDLSGRLIRYLSLGNAERTTWDAADHQGRPVPAGVYFARLQAGEFSQTQRIVLVQ